MMNLLHGLSAFMLLGAAAILTACDKEDDYTGSSVSQTPASKVTKPALKKDLTTTTYMDLSLRCIFKNGGDTWNNMNCKVHWRAYSKKQTVTPKESDLTKHETMRQYSTTSVSTTFDKTHTGFNGGTYVYYYFECSNSKYTTKTDVTYCVVKR